MSVENRLITSKLLKQEEVIERGYIDCGKALAIIRDEELYKVDYDSFEQYVKVRWDYSKSRAYQLIEASTIVDALPPEHRPKNESQAREITKAPPEKQAEVAKSVAEKCKQEERQPTAKDYKQAVEQATAPQSEPEPVYDDMDDDDETIDSKPKGKPLAIENGNLIRSIVDLINEARRELDAIEKAPGLEELCSARRSIDRELQSTKASLVNCIPHSVCPRCNGRRCTQCGNLGWCNAQLAKELTT